MYLFCVCISNQKLINYFNNFLICTEVTSGYYYLHQWVYSIHTAAELAA